MKKVLYLINYAGKGGSEKYVYNLIERYHEKKCECFFVYNEHGPLCEQLEELGVTPKRIEMKNPFDFKAAKELSEYCREKDIDVIHAQYPRENYIALLAKRRYKKLKVVYTFHINMKTGFLWKLANKAMNGKNHKVIAVCNYGRDLLIENGFPKDKIEVIYNGARMDERHEKKPGFKKELGVAEDTLVMSILARYEKLKGLDFLVDSIKLLKEKTERKFCLLIAGDGELFDETGEKIKELGLEAYVKQLGFRKDTADILAVSDIYINSSSSEALSFAIVEALVNGLPVVATNVGGNPDIVSKENDCGILVEYGDSEGMAEALKELLENDGKREKYSKNAEYAAENVFNSDKLLDDTFKIYE